MRGALPVLVLLAAPAALAQRWELQYFYDHDREVLHFADIAFPTPERGVAVGSIVDEQNPRRRDPVALVTNDGGETWTRVALEQDPVSLFFLDESTGWMVTDRGIWITQESGRSWRRINRHEEFAIRSVWFLDRQRGFAAGAEKSAYETHDGGQTWQPITEAAKPPGNPGYTAYTHIGFADSRHGLIVGSSTPPGSRGQVRLEPGEYPEAVLQRRLGPTLTLELETSDGGASWRSSTAPLFGQVASLKLSGTDGLILFAYNLVFEWPSEVYHVDLRTGKSASSFRQKGVRINDVALFGEKRAVIAGVETIGDLPAPQVPSRVRILSSTDLNEWIEMPVDYRAVGRFVKLAGPDAEHQWLATDTGMILHLQP